MSALVDKQFTVIWIHPRGDNLRSIVESVSSNTDTGKSKIFTPRPATVQSVLDYASKNGMLRGKSEFTYFVGEPVDIFYHPPPANGEEGARAAHNVAADALLVKLDVGGEGVSASDIQPHGLCLAVPGGLGDNGSDQIADRMSKVSICKMCATIGQIGGLATDASKMELVKRHWEWYDPAKGDGIDKSTGEVQRNGQSLGGMVGSTKNKGVVYPEEMITTTPSGLKYVVTKEGIGARKPQPGTVVQAHYCGWLDAFESDKKFDSSRDKQKVFEFQVGVGNVIQAWDEAILDMKKREQRMIICPPDIAYGDRGAGGGIIPPGATLYFWIELIGWA